MEFITVGDIAIVPLISALTELIKRTGLLKDDKFSAVVSTILGVVFGVIYVVPNDLPQGILTGLVLGLSAVGLYSGVKNTAQGIKK